MIHFINPSAGEWFWFVTTLSVGFFCGWKVGRAPLRRRLSKLTPKSK